MRQERAGLAKRGQRQRPQTADTLLGRVLAREHVGKDDAKDIITGVGMRGNKGVAEQVHRLATKPLQWTHTHTHTRRHTHTRTHADT